jgi:hypothetical protein
MIYSMEIFPPWPLQHCHRRQLSPRLLLRVWLVCLFRDTGALSDICCSVAVDPKYEKYLKMKKMLPEGAVRQKMMQDGCSEAEIEGLLNGTLGAAPAPAPAAAVEATAAPGGYL